MGKNKQLKPQPSVRESIGLDAASEGDPKGARRFLDFVHGELTMMVIGTDMPEAVSERIKAAANDCREAVIFIDGFCAER